MGPTGVTYYTSSNVKTKEVAYTYDVWDRRIQKNVDDTGNGSFDWGERYVHDESGGLEPVLFVFDSGATGDPRGWRIW